ncbi:zinc ABC transporter substrate-binding protein [Limibaculum sp. FT325]|uniref:metal ABC transporter solute-binding protein, Zn/Mn family n=1 Tax=Thermohalobaculum sediminis TaxID=2939436 RepID=UPI0020C05742|nr:zinc ABC transporter substrate-binding protein [Limibaculum sediminis]MCL5775982.1 zinc ABC transporter substrate-binding protein [Limibaculum sediminis]
MSTEDHFPMLRRAAGAALLSMAVAGGPMAAAAEPLKVVATTGMIGDLAAEVAGACAEVTVMMGPGIDPHLYKPSAGDVGRLSQADAILYSGLYLEGQLGEVLERLSGRVATVAVAERAVPEGDRILTGEGYGVDPHVWMDAALWARVPGVVAGALGGLAPGCAAEMAARAGALETALLALDVWTREAVASIPEGARVLVTAHDAFAYFGRAYGIEVVGIQGVSTESEAGIGDIRAVVDLVVARGIPALFVESTISPRTVEAVIEAARGEGHEVRVGAELYADAMGAAGTADGTYIGMIHANVRAIAGALGGTPPALPPELDTWAARWGVGG